MSEYFTGATFAMQNVAPTDDAIVRRAMLSDGILCGCALSYAGTTLTMEAGHLLVCGRQIRHISTQNWPITGATNGYARLVLSVDLTRTATKDTFDQVVTTIEYATSQEGFASLVRGDINNGATVYRVPVCVVSLGAGGITGIVSSMSKTGAAPGNYGLGGVCVETTDWDAISANGYYWGSVNSPDGNVWWGEVIVRSQNYMEQKVFRSSGSLMREVHRSKTGSNGTWLPWEWVNPPLESGVEYRTTERIHGKAVYKKADSKGNIMYRLDGESVWHGHTTTTTLWVNASPTSSFDAQTVALFDNWSNYDAIGIQFNEGYSEMCAISGRSCQSTTAFPADDANNNVMVHYRWASLVSGGVKFETGYYLTTNGQFQNNDHGIPQKIYGIKGVS